MPSTYYVILRTQQGRRDDVNVVPVGDTLVSGVSSEVVVFALPNKLCDIQAERLRSLGWGEFLKVEMSRDRKVLSVSYWM